MRIGYLLTSLGIGGAERQVVALAELMRERGHAVTIVVLTPPAADQWKTSVEVAHLNLRKTAFSAVASWVRAAKVLRRFQPDILHCHNFHGNIFGRALKPALPDLHVVSTIHNVYEGGWLRMAAYRISDPLSCCTVAVCEAAAKRARQARAVPVRKCSVIVNGIDADEFVPNAERCAMTRHQMGAKDDFIWMSVGRIVPAKNYENLLRAFALVHEAEPHSTLWIAGDGNAEYAERMHLLGIGLGLERVICWLGMRRDIPSLLDASDGFVLASAWEGMPLALGEAMAMEKPVVAADVGGIRELVGDCGYVVQASDSPALAQGMLGVMHATPEARRELGITARRRIRERFTMDANADAWERMYQSVLPRQT